jgi:hypothetical protein
MKWLNAKRAILGSALLAAAVGGAVAVDQGLRWLSRPRPSTHDRPTAPSPMPVASIAVGAQAPDFDLPLLRKNGRISLSSYRGRRPVVLAFGNFSCWIFDDEIRPLDQLYRKYGDRVAFVFVNVREIFHHHKDFKFLYDDYEPSESFAKRRQRVCRALDWLKLSMPAVMDGPDAAVDMRYHAWPTRLVVVDMQGRIAYYGGTPMDNDPDKNMRELTAWLKENLDELTSPAGMRPPALGIAGPRPGPSNGRGVAADVDDP